MSTLAGAALVADLERRFVTVTTRITLSDHVFEILHPRSAEDLISEEDFARDERLPYWADIWPSALILADGLVSTPGVGLRLLELGCGCGVVSTAAAVAGFDVLATDYDDDALAFTRANVWRNAGAEPRTRRVDWRVFPEDLAGFDLVVASDVLYERPYAALVAGAYQRALAPHGLGLLADPGRLAAPAFVEACAELGLAAERAHRVPYAGAPAPQVVDVYQVRRGEG